jgi:hypothetical protein
MPLIFEVSGFFTQELGVGQHLGRFKTRAMNEE